MKRTARELEGPWAFRPIGGESGASWMPATVPGCVHTDLFANGKIGDPFYGTNERDQQWIDKSGWEYRTTFAVDDALLLRGQIDLVCEGLDTYAEVLLNGSVVLSANNMFRSWRVAVKRLLTRADNEIIVQFRSPITEVMPACAALGYVLPTANDQGTPMLSVFTRKAPYHYGWDWGPRFVTSGVWRPMRLDAWDDARIDNVEVLQTELSDARATLHVRAAVVAAGRVGRARVLVRVGSIISEARATLNAGTNLLEADIAIDRPERWWPNGLGQAYLYDVDVDLSVDDTLRDARRTRVGLRTVEVVHREDADGKSFTLHVNGAPVFMKGANYIPQDSFVSRVTNERYVWLIRSAALANMNMLRVWGGGIYENDPFYDQCDELGILVWQDFMFACSMYPGDEAFVENVRLEAIENVRRLRHHPSLALWAGNNEIEVAWARWGWPAKFQLSPAAQETMWNDYKRLFHEVLPRVVAEHDPARFYTRSSPSANDDRVVPDTLGSGDMHYWGVWHAELPYQKYGENISRFMSEYGFQSFPDIGTVARYAPPSAQRIDSSVMLAHQRHPRGNELIRIYMERDLRTPKDFASFLYASQVLQATVIQYAAEAHRRRMPYNAGSLYWQLDDCWPVASWSGIDYFGRWKALHYFVRRFFAPLLVSTVEENGAVSVYVISDRRQDAAVDLIVRLVDFEGLERSRKAIALRVRANSSQSYFALPVAELLRGADARGVVLVAEAMEGQQCTSRSSHYFVKTKDLNLPNPELSLQAVPSAGDRWQVRVAARRLARNVRLSTEGAEGHFSDNYFDILPGEVMTVDWTGPAAPEFHVSSILDTY